MPTLTPKIDLPAKLRGLYEPHRYKVIHGGRGGGKSRGVSMALLDQAARSQLRVLCAREVQLSIRASVHQLLCDQIEALGLGAVYSITRDEIKSVGGSSFIFSGLSQQTAESIKSYEGIDIAWVEEGQSVSKRSWDILTPTIRKPESEIWVTLNPYLESGETYQRFIAQPPRDAWVQRLNWRDNPWFPPVLDAERIQCRLRNPDAYQNIWEGECLKISKAQVFAGKFGVDEFTPQAHWDGPYQGLDWGFAQDPTAAVRCWVNDGVLYIEREASKVGLELDDTSEYLRGCIEGFADYTTRADNARPESISHVKRKGLPRIEAVEKWKGSVEDGVAHMRSYSKIVIHPRCRETIREFGAYSYKTDRLSGDVMPDIVDAFNHLIDATRYALAPLIRAVPVRRSYFG